MDVPHSRDYVLLCSVLLAIEGGGSPVCWILLTPGTGRKICSDSQSFIVSLLLVESWGSVCLILLIIAPDFAGSGMKITSLLSPTCTNVAGQSAHHLFLLSVRGGSNLYLIPSTVLHQGNQNTSGSCYRVGEKSASCWGQLKPESGCVLSSECLSSRAWKKYHLSVFHFTVSLSEAGRSNQNTTFTSPQYHYLTTCIWDHILDLLSHYGSWIFLLY